MPVLSDNGNGSAGSNGTPVPDNTHSAGNGPLILDMDNIPEPDDNDDVW